MSTDVLAKDLRERTRPVLAVSVSLAVLTVFVLGIYAGMRETFDDLTRGFPEELLAFMGGDVAGGYVVAELFGLIAPAALLGYAVMTGASALAGEEESRTLGVLLGAPLSRASLLGSKAAGLAVGVAAVTAAFAAASVGAAMLFDIGLRVDGVLAACLHLGALGLLFGLIGLAAGAATGRSGPAAAIAGGLAVAAYLADSLLPLADLEPWAELTPWFYYAGSQPLANGVHAGHLAVLAVLAAAAYAAARFAFLRRDLRG